MRIALFVWFAAFPVLYWTCIPLVLLAIELAGVTCETVPGEFDTLLIGILAIVIWFLACWSKYSLCSFVLTSTVLGKPGHNLTLS